MRIIPEITKSKCMRITGLSLVIWFFSQATVAADLSRSESSVLTFDPDFLKLSDGNNAKNINLSYFSRSGGLEPGLFRVDILVNGQYVDTQKLNFRSRHEKPGQLFACVAPEVYSSWGITLPREMSSVNVSSCEGIDRLIPQAREKLDLNKRELLLTVPQRFLTPSGWLNTPPRLWDEGMPAAMLNYTFSGSQQSNTGQHNSSRFLSLNTAVNLGGWRFRNDSNWIAGSGMTERWQSLNTWLQHDYAWGQGGQFTVGQTSTDGTITDSFPFEGFQIASDDGMLEALLTSYAPVIRGVASSQAQVTIRQNGSVLYQKNVPPGPFAFHDVPQLYSGDVTVEVREADGTVHRTVQAAASVPVLQRENRLRYNLAAGRYRQMNGIKGEEPVFMQGTAAWGLPADVTLYGGATQARNYHAAILGTGKYFESLGALSFDITYAQSRFTSRYSDLDIQKGESYRFEYANSFDTTNTTFSLTGYRYATKGFYSFNELQQLQSDDSNKPDYHQRSRLMTTLSQDFGESGQLNLSGSLDSYWNYDDKGYNWTVTYNKVFSVVAASLSLGYSRTPQYNQADKAVFMNLSVPLSYWTGSGNASLNSSTGISNNQVQQQAGLSGSLDAGQLTYGMMQGWQNQGRGVNGNFSLAYQSTYGQLNGGYNYQQNSNQWLYGASGGVTLHSHGVTFSQPVSLNGGNVLLEAPGARGIPVLSGTGIATDWRGYTVVPSLIPYQRNSIGLDVSQLPDNVDIQATDRTVIPTRGALVPSPFNVSIGGRALVTLTYHGKPVPFGSTVTLRSETRTVTGLSADEGLVYLRGLPEQGRLLVQWGKSAESQCTAEYRLTSSPVVINDIKAVCR
ncbi:fimbrial biogenesis outer membrane usher protein [Salmonella enterica]|nr:fimbrial biogenesis outer membrane usher protein [Salmonella enterica]ELK7009260.1 fimbrial biogenesis outer membrane usher protein [Salmonella enterica]